MRRFRFKKVLNQHESLTHKRLMDFCHKKGVRIFSKVRMADILPIENSGIDDSDYHFALSGHFDFVVADSKSEPLFAVEFDVPHHDSDEDQKRRDAIKDKLVEYFNFPLLRVRSTHLQKKIRWLGSSDLDSRCMVYATGSGQDVCGWGTSLRL